MIDSPGPRAQKRPMRRLLIATMVFASGAAGCARSPGVARSPLPAGVAPLADPIIAAESAFVDSVAPGVIHRTWHLVRGPWVVHVLDVDRAACWSAVAVKPYGTTVGRATTSALVGGLTRSSGGLRKSVVRVAGGVNADFFLFAPPGIPQTAHIEDGVVIASPSVRPVFAVDSAGRPSITTLSFSGVAVSGVDSITIDAWNRASRSGIALFDARYAPRTDTATGVLRVVLGALPDGDVLALDSSVAGVAIPASGGVLVAGQGTSDALRARLNLLGRARGRFTVRLRVLSFHPREAVGGFPVLIRNGAEVPALDSTGANFGPVRHPRTAVGIAAAGRRLFLLTVDGRQPGYSAGMTLRELAAFMRELGATDALNLDGGGSTTLVVRDGKGATRVANRPSDAAGERAVGNALGIAKGCAPSR